LVNDTTPTYAIPVVCNCRTSPPASHSTFAWKTGQPLRRSSGLRDRVDELAEFVTAAEKRYQVEAGSWTAIGFSNGANVASALLMRHPEALRAAVLLAAMVPFADPPAVDRTGKRVLLANGIQDPMATAAHTDGLVTQLRARGAEVVVLPHDGGHTVEMRQLPRIAEFVQG
jgi:phospholipase/carboxylesterase